MHPNTVTACQYFVVSLLIMSAYGQNVFCPCWNPNCLPMPHWVQKAPYLVAKTAVSSSANLHDSYALRVHKSDTLRMLNLPSKYMKFWAAYNSDYINSKTFLFMYFHMKFLHWTHWFRKEKVKRCEYATWELPQGLYFVSFKNRPIKIQLSSL